MPTAFEPLRVLLTCRDLALRGGSQLYTRDVASALRELGHTPIVFSPRPGPVADDLRARGVAVIDSLDLLGETPSVIHGQHHLEAMAAMLRFPGVPAIFVCHGWLPWQEAPPKFPSIGRYVAVDSLRRDRLVFEHGIPESDVEILPNFVEVSRFPPRAALPKQPARALLFSNQATADGALAAAVRRACAGRGIALDVAGDASGNPLARPEDVLSRYDLVFARGRSAMEAMSTGSAVVLCDIEGCGPMVDPFNFDVLRALNFGLSALAEPASSDTVRSRLARYDPDAAALVSRRVRDECDRRPVVERLVEIYRLAGAARPRNRDAAWAAECLDAASRYLSWLGPFFEGQLETARTAALDSRDAPPPPNLREEPGAVARAIEDRLASREADLEALWGAYGASRERLGNTEKDLRDASEALRVLQRSPFSRVRAFFLGFKPLVAAYHVLRGRHAGL